MGGFTDRDAHRLLDLARTLPTDALCTFDGISSDVTSISLRWSTGGTSLPPVSIRRRAYAPASALSPCEFTFDLPPEVALRCPMLAASMVRLRDELAREVPIVPAPPKHTWAWGVFAMLAFLGFASSVWLRLPRAGSLATRVSSWEVAPIAALLVVPAVVAAAVAVQFVSPLVPEIATGTLERVFFLSTRSPLESLLRAPDTRHPGLWAALLHIPFERSGHSLAVLEIFGRSCAGLSVLLAGAIVWKVAGRLAGILAMACLAALPLLGAQAEDPGDMTLFVLLALVSLGCWIRLLERSTPGRSMAFAVAMACAANTSYAAIPVFGAFWLHALLRERRGPILKPLLLASALILPRFLFLAGNFQGEVATSRRGERLMPLQDFLIAFCRDALSPQFSFLLLPAIACAYWVGRRSLSASAPRTAMLFVMLGTAGFIPLQPFVRVETYYLLLLPVMAVMLLASLAGPRQPREPAGPAAQRRVAAAAVSVGATVAFALASGDRIADAVSRARSPGSIRAALELVSKDGGTVLLYDQLDAESVLYWFFRDPYRAYFSRTDTESGKGGGPDGGFTAFRDPDSDRRAFHLALSSGDIARAEALLNRVRRDVPVHVLLNTYYPSDAFEASVRTSCQLLSERRPVKLFRCPRAPPTEALTGTTAAAGVE